MIVLAALLAAAAPAPLDQDQPPDATMMVEPIAMMIATFDSDGNARVTRAELAAGVARSFAAIDTDRRGSIDYIQYGDWAERFLGDRNALPSPFEVDGDHDGRITPAELQAAFDQAFARLDRDRDGVLTRAELLTIRANPLGDEGGRRRHRR
ncbi:MAG: EF-hand domain-containing protein [Sphingomonas sp.]